MPLQYPAVALVRSLPNNAGLYLHIPFCARRCAYCNFYSAVYSEQMLDRFTKGLIREIKKWGGSFNRPIDTLYIGGGTPSLLGQRIIDIVDAAMEAFNILPDAEITAEMNPSDEQNGFLHYAKKAGVNRLSIGVQSGIDAELKTLGRRHTARDAERTVAAARKEGFDNISLDLMLCLPESDIATLSKSIDFVLSLDPEHISAYMLKIEPDTLLFAQKPSLPDDDAQVQQYLFMCERLEKAGYEHYEISNFAKTGRISHHNMKYWTLVDYLGIGPSAHSFVDGRRFHYPEDLRRFISDANTVDDGITDDSERIMLGLRLKQGININEPSAQLKAFLLQSERAGLINIKGENISLTNNGMLVSNSIITEITELLYEDI